MFQKDSIIPSSLYYLPLLKRMTELDGPIRVELVGEPGEAVEVKAPDGETAKLDVQREEWAVFYQLAGKEYKSCLRTWKDMPAPLEAQLIAAIKDHLSESGTDLSVKYKNRDGLVQRSVSLGPTGTTLQDKPELFLWVETCNAEFGARAERAKADAHRRMAQDQMDKKRAEKRRAEEERQRREQEAAAKELAKTPIDDLVDEANTEDAFVTAWESLDPAQKCQFDKDMNAEALTPEQRLEVVSLARTLEAQFDSAPADAETVAAAAIPTEALERSEEDYKLTHDPTGMPYAFDDLDDTGKAAWERLNGSQGSTEATAAPEATAEAEGTTKRRRGRPRKDKNAEGRKAV